MHIFATSFQPITVQSNCYANFSLRKGQCQEKLNKLIERASATLHHPKRSIREVAEVIGLIVSSFPAHQLRSIRQSWLGCDV